MAVTRCSLVCFSPAGSTRKIAEHIAAGTGLPLKTHDLTLPRARSGRSFSLAASDLAIVAVPVYFGRVPRTAVSALAKVRGRKTPAVLAVNYGNRHYDDALLELHEIACNAGFLPLAAGAFVSRHSYATEAYPLAVGRPDADDLDMAAFLGRSALAACARPAKTTLALPGNRPYRPYPEMFRAPLTVEGCILCGACVKACPTGAVVLGADNPVTDEKKCIMCQACVAACPQKVRLDTAPGAEETRERLTPLVKARRNVELFLPESLLFSAKTE